MTAKILRLPTLALAILCLAIINQSQATLCATVCEKSPQSCPYGEKASGFEVCLSTNRTFATCTILTRFVRRDAGVAASPSSATAHPHSNEL
ncbi:hypothetical protein N7445_000728 [Penicillium cf. griseofulvum]|nr:hypothetical protein N7445_000728 [Penicillium cf. griseofulvum]